MRGFRLGRWLLFVTALALAAAGGYALVGGGARTLPVASGPPPLDEIDPASRARLERVLREADRAEAARPSANESRP
jgi:hypothetical protein